MKFKSLLLVSIAVCGANSAMADGPSVSFNVGAASDYVWRGISQTLNDPELFAGADLTYGSFYAGTWVSNVDFGDDTDLELDVYGGYKTKLGAIDADFGVLYYSYPGSSEFNFLELKGAGTYAFKSGTALTGSVFYSPEVGEDGPSSVYTEAALSVPLPAKLGPFSLSAVGSLGYYKYDDIFEDYTNFKIGLSAAAEKGWTVDLAFTDTDLGDSDLTNNIVYLGLKKTF